MGRAAAAGRRGVDLVADAFLSAPATPVDEEPAGAALFTAAPGRADTAAVLSALRPGPTATAARDLGGVVASRLARLERARLIADGEAGRAMLAWCPSADEGLSVAHALILGRLAALIRPGRVVVLWFAAAGVPVGRPPTACQVDRARRLAEAALPGVTVALHCLGWTDDPRRQLEDLAARFA